MTSRASDLTTQQLIDGLDVIAFYSAHVPGFKVNGHVNVKVRCPFGCGDDHSFSVDRETGLFFCHRCNAKGSPWGFLEAQHQGPGQIRSTLMEYQRGGTFRPTPAITMGAKPDKAQLGPIVATYDYTDERGALLFQVTRHEPKDFRQRRPDGNGGWIGNLGDVRRVLYQLPGLVVAAASKWTVYICEGEKDVDAINGLESGGEFFATCNPMGAGKWRPEYSDIFRGVPVVIIADKDERGREHALNVRFHLQGVAASVEIREAKAGKDAYDHLVVHGHSLADFVPMAEPGASDVVALEPTSFRDVSNPDVLKVPWLIEGLIPASGLTIVAAHYKVGKTFLVYRLILDALFGKLALGSFPIPRPLRVQLWQFEMPLDVNLRRFHKLARGMGIDPERIYDAEKAGQFQAFVQPDISLADAGDLAVFHEAVTTFGPDLLLVDSLSEAFPGVDINKGHEVRTMLRHAFGPVTVAGRGTVGLHHKRKAPANGKDDDKGSILGSQGFGAAARTIYTLDRVLDDGPDIKGRFVVSLAPQGGWDLETTGSVFVIADNEAGTQTTVDPAKGKKGKAFKSVTATMQAAVRLAQLVATRHTLGRQSAFEIVRLELKCGLSTVKDALALAIERKWIAKAKGGGKQNEKVLEPGVNTDWEDEL